VAAATAAAEERRQLLAAELEQQARQHRVRRAYVRPPS
jgi:heme exporter protein D